MAEYANYPVSLAERKAEASGKARDWTPRDALISVLRDLDAGKNERNTHFAMSSPDCLTGLGLLSRVAHMINEAG